MRRDAVRSETWKLNVPPPPLRVRQSPVRACGVRRALWIFAKRSSRPEYELKNTQKKSCPYIWTFTYTYCVFGGWRVRGGGLTPSLIVRVLPKSVRPNRRLRSIVFVFDCYTKNDHGVCYFNDKKKKKSVTFYKESVECDAPCTHSTF